MEETKGKYFTGRSVDIPKEDDELDIAIKQWAEGNPHLEAALRQCIDNRVKTIASCAGHDKWDDDPYISMEIIDESRKKIYSILSSVFKFRKGISSVDVENTIDEQGNNRAYLTIHAKTRYKDEIFDAITEGTKKEIDLDMCPPIVRKMMEIENRGEKIDLSYNNISFSNLGPAKAIVLMNDTIQRNKALYDRVGIKHSINLCLTDRQVLSKLGSIGEAIGVHSQDVKERIN